MSTKIRVVDYKKLPEPKTARRVGPGRYGTWARLHDRLCKALSRYGKVGRTERSDFYHSGDWFDSHQDGFALMTPTAISSSAFLALHRTIARHHKHSIVILEGQVLTPFTDLVVM